MKDIFLHIPKCGGSTIRDVMLSKFSRDRIIRIYSDNEKINSYSATSFLNKFSAGLPADIDAICGHINYEQITEVVSLKDFRGFSLIRDPIERAISNINYMKLSLKHNGHRMATSVTKDNLFEHISKLRLVNYQFKFLGGSNVRNIDAISDEIKLYKVDSYKVALQDMGYIMGGDVVTIRNVTKDLLKQPAILEDAQLLSISDLCKEEIEELRRLNYLDYKLLSAAI
jgi:hypothetical protein